MTIQSIAAYRLPADQDLPENRLPWTPDPGRAVLLVHDMQSYFVRFYEANQPPLSDAIARMQELLERCRSQGVPVAYSAQPADPAAADRMLLSDLWGPGLTAFPEQADIVPALAPMPGEKILRKTRYSAFYKTELARYVRESGRDQLWICGVYAHIGCMLTAFDAFMHDIKPFLVLDAVMDFSREYHDMAGRLVSERCGVVVSVADLMRTMSMATLDARNRSLMQTLLSGLIEEDGPPEAELRDLGFDSVRALELVERLQQHGFMVDSASVLECQRLEQLYDLVQQNAAGLATHTNEQGAP